MEIKITYKCPTCWDKRISFSDEKEFSKRLIVYCDYCVTKKMNIVDFTYIDIWYCPDCNLHFKTTNCINCGKTNRPGTRSDYKRLSVRS